MPIWSFSRYKKVDKGSKFNGKLPTELWAMIIDFIVVPLRYPYLYCEPETFPQYEALFRNVDTSDKIPFLDDWKRIRAVCKQWKHFAGVNPCFFLQKQRWPKYSKPIIHQDTSIVFIYSKTNSRLSMECIAHLKENLTTLALGSSTPPYIDALDVLLEDPSMFPNLCCLSIHSSRTTRPFWKVIQDEFPNLISLTVRSDAYGSPGRYVLKNLEILSIPSLAGFELVCPSLKHLCYHSIQWTQAREFILRHAHQLQSFIGFIPVPPNREENVWSSVFPSLVMSGGSMRYGPPRGVPPPGHPLRHLRLTPKYTGWKSEDVMREIDAYGFPEIKSVHVNMNEMRYGTTDALRARCRRRGIRLVEIVDGKPPLIPPPRPMKDYIKTAFRFCTLPCWWPCLEFDARYYD
ncbi:hypothetical protein FRC18_009778 [Serendipita sp. 400]|nr:hypothetical protein FRC18_009778 [Serendipita sp. 400]